MLYTTYFSMVSRLPKDVIPMAICVKVPGWYSGPTFKILAPPSDVLWTYKRDGDVQTFTDRYVEEVLGHLDPVAIASQLSELVGYFGFNHVALVCWEAPDKFCHRQLVAEWLRASGVDVKEFEL